MKIINKKAYHNYEIIQEYEVGIKLHGNEYKSVLEGRIKLDTAYVRMKNGEAYLLNAEIFKYKYCGDLEYDRTRERKLLLHKKEIIKMETKLLSQTGLTVIAISCYTKGKYVKFCIALAKGRTDVGKRKREKDRSIKRREEQETKKYIHKK